MMAEELWVIVSTVSRRKLVKKHLYTKFYFCESKVLTISVKNYEKQCKSLFLQLCYGNVAWQTHPLLSFINLSNLIFPRSLNKVVLLHCERRSRHCRVQPVYLYILYRVSGQFTFLTPTHCNLKGTNTEPEVNYWRGSVTFLFMQLNFSKK